MSSGLSGGFSSPRRILFVEHAVLGFEKLDFRLDGFDVEIHAGLSPIAPGNRGIIAKPALGGEAPETRNIPRRFGPSGRNPGADEVRDHRASGRRRRWRGRQRRNPRRDFPRRGDGSISALLMIMTMSAGSGGDGTVLANDFKPLNFAALIRARPYLRKLIHSRLAKPARRYYDDLVTSPHPAGGAMTLEDHIEELRTRHHRIEIELDHEIHRPHPDDVTVTGLKRKKLRIKDEIFQLEHER